MDTIPVNPVEPISLPVPESLSIFAAICAFASGAAMICQALSLTPPGSIDMPRVYAGLAETWIPVFVSFGFLAVSWLLIAAVPVPVVPEE